MSTAARTTAGLVWHHRAGGGKRQRAYLTIATVALAASAAPPITTTTPSGRLAASLRQAHKPSCSATTSQDASTHCVILGRCCAHLLLASAKIAPPAAAMDARVPSPHAGAASACASTPPADEAGEASASGSPAIDGPRSLSA